MARRPNTTTARSSRPEINNRKARMVIPNGRERCTLDTPAAIVIASLDILTIVLLTPMQASLLVKASNKYANFLVCHVLAMITYSGGKLLYRGTC
jgi:hypothetical protein